MARHPASAGTAESSTYDAATCAGVNPMDFSTPRRLVPAMTAPLTTLITISTEIAAELFISLGTVKTHVTRIQDKLEIRNRVELAAWSWENRIMESSP